MKNIINEEFIPKRQTMGSAGYDIYAVEDMKITNHFKVFDTGVCLENTDLVYNTIHYPKSKNMNSFNTRVEFFQHWHAQIHPRSSYAIKKGMQVANISIIDQDYRDTIKIAIKSDEPFTISKGDRYAQMIFIPNAIILGEVRPNAHRDGGIGSTDKDKQTKLEVE